MREVFYIFITCIITLIFLKLAPQPELNTHGIFMPAGTANHSIIKSKIISKNVAIGTSAVNTKPLGQISVMQRSNNLTEKTNENIEQQMGGFAKKLAAENQANYLQIIDFTPQRTLNELDAYQIKFNAYRV